MVWSDGNGNEVQPKPFVDFPKEAAEFLAEYNFYEEFQLEAKRTYVTGR